jgi:acetyltransferase
MEQTQIYSALKGARGEAPVDLDALDQLLIRFSSLVLNHPMIQEIDINPLRVSGKRMVALDARIVLHSPEINPSDLPKPAIRPYPSQWVTKWKTKSGLDVVIRPIKPEDEPMMIQFHKELSERSVYHRYFAPLKLDVRIAHERLSRICFTDYTREIALIVEHSTEQKGVQVKSVLGVGRLSKLHGTDEAEFALLIMDRWQNQGLGTQLLHLLVKAGIEEKVGRIVARILADNYEMMSLARKVGFRLYHEPSQTEWTAVKPLDTGGMNEQVV